MAIRPTKGIPMATVEEYRLCEVCEGRHTFCEPSSDSLVQGAMYEFVCPTFGMMGRFIAADAWPEIAPTCPDGAVIVWPAAGSNFPKPKTP